MAIGDILKKEGESAARKAVETSREIGKAAKKGDAERVKELTESRREDFVRSRSRGGATSQKRGKPALPASSKQETQVRSNDNISLRTGGSTYVPPPETNISRVDSNLSTRTGTEKVSSRYDYNFLTVTGRAENVKNGVRQGPGGFFGRVKELRETSTIARQTATTRGGRVRAGASQFVSGVLPESKQELQRTGVNLVRSVGVGVGAGLAFTAGTAIGGPVGTVTVASLYASGVVGLGYAGYKTTKAVSESPKGTALITAGQAGREIGVSTVGGFAGVKAGVGIGKAQVKITSPTRGEELSIGGSKVSRMERSFYESELKSRGLTTRKPGSKTSSPYRIERTPTGKRLLTKSTGEEVISYNIPETRRTIALGKKGQTQLTRLISRQRSNTRTASKSKTSPELIRERFQRSLDVIKEASGRTGVRRNIDFLSTGKTYRVDIGKPIVSSFTPSSAALISGVGVSVGAGIKDFTVTSPVSRTTTNVGVRQEPIQDLNVRQDQKIKQEPVTEVINVYTPPIPKTPMGTDILTPTSPPVQKITRTPVVLKNRTPPPPGLPDFRTNLGSFITRKKSTFRNKRGKKDYTPSIAGLISKSKKRNIKTSKLTGLTIRGF